jgi:ferric-dicitrate binding protein FerR (iron transport regulator)
VETGGQGSLAVETPQGIVRDVGTRFEVRLTPLALRVRVRDGGVRLSRDRREYDAGPGDEITVEAAGAVSHRTIAVDGTLWAWTTGEAVSFDIEGRSAHEFLAWLADENDWQLRYDDGAVEQKARATTLHGSIRGLTADQSLAAVLPASGIEHQRDGRVLTIRLVRGDAP